ncbi:hypothetical protein BHE90_001028 [Fusarium euwallaceae]|uniref:Zn(2)-C6 fungal-type domain-containing protein n=1 Tax=Fusarium euwallaceae TaxID=1147111 RepID=A0A430M8V7_9HYPO|nr:hypothetical protein BHE90_001028 [Fusarium euwallaceae]
MSKRACDACKQRKVKCDQTPPACTPCRNADLVCTYVVPRRKRGPKPKTRPRDMEITLNDDPSGASWVSQFSPASLQSSPSHTREEVPQLSAVVEPTDGMATSLALACHGKLLAGLALATGEFASDPEKLTRRCVDLFISYIFPLVPVVRESTLRSLSLVLPPFAEHLEAPLGDLRSEMIDSIRSYSLLTAVCSTVLRSMPLEVCPQGDDLAALFLNASETTLRLFSSQDIANPTSSSISIRIIHASCHHVLGEANLSWSIMDEAKRLAVQMRLYDESSYEILDPIEAQLRRNAFWSLYSSDRSACLLNSRPLQLDEFRLQAPFTTLFKTSQATPLLGLDESSHLHQFEECILQGFLKNHDVWDLGHAILFNLQLFATANIRAGEGASINKTQQQSLSESYLRFLSSLDSIPDLIASPNTLCASSDGQLLVYQRRALWVQKANLILTYHYLRMMILDRFIAANLHCLLGLNDDPTSLKCRKVEIAHDVLELVTSVPFESLQANGESCVEKLRLVCATLLEVLQNCESVHILERAKSHFAALLDVLSKLNSRSASLQWVRRLYVSRIGKILVFHNLHNDNFTAMGS